MQELRRVESGTINENKGPTTLIYLRNVPIDARTNVPEPVW